MANPNRVSPPTPPCSRLEQGAAIKPIFHRAPMHPNLKQVRRPLATVA